MKEIIIELKAENERALQSVLETLNATNLFELDRNYQPVRIKRRREKEGPSTPDTYAVRGMVSEENIQRLSRLPFVYQIWKDTKIDHFLGKCNSSRKGTLDDVAECIGAKQLWGKGYRGEGIVIGIVDGGIDKTKISAVINGSSPDWGTNVNWDEHANMTATDALGVAPDAKIYDLRIAGIATATISNALQAFDWAIQQFDIDGTPQILSNSWGIFQESWDTDYATNPNHPFTLKVEEALDKGIKVLFAAGNCGETCPDKKKCGSDTGGGRDIWGANGHPEVMTVGAVKLNNHRLKYSSQGPAALSNAKPDFCTYSSFKGYFKKDSGTSAACPVAAGAVALLLDHDDSLSQFQIKTLLQNTAKDIENIGFDYNTGYGVIRLDNAYYELNPAEKPKRDFRDKLCEYVYHTERQCVKWEENHYKECAQTRDDGYYVCTQWAEQGYHACSQWAEQGYHACSQWADQGYNQCSQWADQGYDTCSQWADQGYDECCDWWPCSWGCKALVWISNWVCVAQIWVASWVCVATIWISSWVCVATVWISSWVCVAWVWISSWVCLAWVWASYIVCVVWTWIVTRVCKLYLWVITAITLTNCKCR